MQFTKSSIPDELLTAFIAGLTQRLQRLTDLVKTLKQPDLAAAERAQEVELLLRESLNLCDAAFMYEQLELERQARRFYLDVVDLHKHINWRSGSESLGLLEQALVKLAVRVTECQQLNKERLRNSLINCCTE